MFSMYNGAARLAAAAASLVLTLILGQLAALAQGKILVDGSTGTAPLVEVLGKAFAAKGGATVEIGKGMGTKARLQALADGKIDIAMASHGLNVEEVTRQGMTVVPIARTAVVFAVHSSVKVASLTQAQVCAIYEGKHTNWKELEGSDLAIVPHARPDSEVPTEVIRGGIACLKAMTFGGATKVMAKGGDMRRGLSETPGAFGVVSATDIEQSKGKMRAVALDGVRADEENVASGRYRLVRDAFLVTRNSASAPVKAFVTFAKSPEGADVIRANGAIAVK